MSYSNHSLPYSQDDIQFTQPHYPELLADPAAEGRTVLYPSQLHPLFTRQGHNPPPPFTPQEHGWPPYDHSICPQDYSYPPYPSPSPFPPPRLSPPPIHHTPIHFKSRQNTSPTSSQNQNQRLTLAGSLDPSTGIFYRTPEHPRLRTAQACEKCRTRKAKCSGEHPACKRCLTRGLVCEYAKEGRVRGPNKAKSKPSNTSPSNTPNGHARIATRGRTSSANSSVESSEHPDSLGTKISSVKREQETGPRRGVQIARRNSLSLGEHRSSRPRPPDLQMESASGILYRSSPVDDLNGSGFPPFPRYQSQAEYGQVDTRQVRSMHQPQMSYHQQYPYQLHREQPIHLQKNMNVIQVHSQGQTTPSLSSPQERLQGMVHTQTDHLMMSYSASPLQSPSMAEEFIYSPSYLQHQSFPQYPVRNGSRNATTGGSSPHTSVGGTSTMGSPLTPASAPPFVISPPASRSMKMDLDMTSLDPTLRGPRNGLRGSVPIEPVWVDLVQANTYPEHPIQGTDEGRQNGFLDDNKHQSTQNGGDIFMKDGQSHEQGHFHGQSQSRNETQHYPASDLQMC